MGYGCDLSEITQVEKLLILGEFYARSARMSLIWDRSLDFSLLCQTAGKLCDLILDYGDKAGDIPSHPWHLL